MDFVAVETEPRDMELHAFNVRRRLRSGQSHPHTSMATPRATCHPKGWWQWLALARRRGPIPIAEILAIATQIATALEAALHFTS